MPPEGTWCQSTEPAFENLVTGHCVALDLPIFGGWRRHRDDYETVLLRQPDGKYKWIQRDKT